ncbi:MAG: hypothetical protein ACR2JF_05900 [Iamia sp.]
MPGFPNLFCLYEPGTNLAHGGGMIFHAECQVRYVEEALARLVARHPNWGRSRGSGPRNLPQNDGGGAERSVRR